MRLRVGWSFRLCIAAALCALAAPGTNAFTPLGFRTYAEIMARDIQYWQKTGIVLGQPFHLSFAIDQNFLSNQANVTPEQSRAAVLSAMHSWSQASLGHITFEEAPWQAVPNSGSGPPVRWEGPSIEEWLEDAALPPDEQQYGLAWRPGWGANVDVFSRPTGFTITSGVQTFNMTPQTLAFSIVNRSATRILSVDIYLNENYTWRTNGGQFDIETVILHELGHGLGLDHPDQAVEMGSVNLCPIMFAPGHNATASEPMFSLYTGVKRTPTLDEIGAVRFIYTFQAAKPAGAADLNGDGIVDAQDLSIILGLWGTPDPLGDISGDGIVGVFDLAILLGAWGVAPAAAPPTVGPDEPAADTPFDTAQIDGLRPIDPTTQLISADPE